MPASKYLIKRQLCGWETQEVDDNRKSQVWVMPLRSQSTVKTFRTSPDVTPSFTKDGHLSLVGAIFCSYTS